MKEMRRIGIVLLLVMTFFACTMTVDFLFSPAVISESQFTNAQTINFSWEPVENATHYLYRIGQDGEWKQSTETKVSLSNVETGIYVIYVKAIYAVEETVLESSVASYKVVVDRQAPEQPTWTSSLTETRNNKPVWSWAVPAGADQFSYRLSNGIDESAEATIVSKYVAMFQPVQELVEGDWTLYLKAGDLAGNWSEEISQTIKINLTALDAPLVVRPEVFSPEIDEDGKRNVTKSRQPQWSWSMADDTLVVNEFRYQLNGEFEGAWQNVLPNTTAFTPNNELGDGEHTLYVQAQNLINEAPGNWSPSGSYTFIVDSTGPESPIVSGATLTNETKPTWSWSLPEGVEDVAGFRCDFNGQGDFDVALDDGESGVWTFSPSFELTTNTEEGYYLKVYAKDILGNESVAGDWTIKINTAAANAPIITLVGAKQDGLGNWITADPFITVKWEQENTESINSYEYKLGDSAWVEVSNTVLSKSYLGEERLSEGKYAFYVRSKDNVGDGNYSEEGVFSFEVDLTAPITPVVTGPEVTGDVRPTWSWSVDADVYEYQCQINGGAWFPVLTPGSYQPASDLTAADTDLGAPYVFGLRGRDFIGNWSAIGTTETGISSIIPPAPPVVLEGNNPTNNRRPTWTWEFPSNILEMQYKLNDEDATIITNSASFVETYTSLANLGAEGEITEQVFSVRVKMINGVYSSWGESRVLIDLKGPDPVDLTGNALLTGDKFTLLKWKHANILDVAKFSVTVNSDWSDIPVADFQEFDNSWSEIPESSDGKWSFYKIGREYFVKSLVALSDGQQTMKVKAFDSFGNASLEAQHTLTLNTSALKPPVLSLNPDDIIINLGGLSYINTETPIINWAPASGENVAEVKAIRYTAIEGANWTIKSGNALDAIQPGEYFPIGQGLKTYWVSIQNEVGNWSDAASISLSVDTEPPARPIVTTKGTPTSDTTPSWTWQHANIDEVAEFRYQVQSGFATEDPAQWTSLPSSTLGYIPTTALAYGDWTLYVQARDLAGNWSTSGSFMLTISAEAINHGRPGKIFLSSVSKGSYSSAIRVGWVKDLEATHYEIYRLDQNDYDSGDRNGSFLAKVAASDFDANPYYYDKAAVPDTNYYYRIRGIQELGEAPINGEFSNFIREASNGYLLAKPTNFRIVKNGSDSKFRLIWDSVAGADQYMLLRSGPHSTSLSAEALEGANWEYLPTNGTQWANLDGEINVDAMNILSSTSYLDNAATDSMAYYYYKVFAINRDAKEDQNIINEGQLSGNYFLSEPTVSFGYILDLDLAGWLTVSDNDRSSDKAYGKIKLEVTVPATDRHYMDNLQVQVRRTYRYGGGYQGHNATRSDKSSHTNLTNPNPAAVSWEKTITLEYPFSADTLKTATVTQWDTMYDVNDSGEKLIAALDKNTSQSGGTSYPWYERTQAQMDSMGKWEKIYDTDGTPSEMEFHYLKWDWIVRKAMNHSANPNKDSNKIKRFDINLMTRADYQVVVKHKDPSVTDEIVGPVVYGWPALTPREFAFLVMLAREVSFYRVGVSFADEHREQGFGDAGNAANDVTAKGAVSGHILTRNGGLDGFSGAKADVFTSNNGSSNDGGHIEDLPGVKVTLSWRPFKLGFGGPNKNLDGHEIKVATPRWSGSTYITAYLYGGTYLHGIHPQDSFFEIKYAKWNRTRVSSTLHANASAVQGQGAMALEYLNDGFTWWRTTSSGSNKNTYFDRYTSVNWSFEGRAYPGF